MTMMWTIIYFSKAIKAETLQYAMTVFSCPFLDVLLLFLFFAYAFSITFTCPLKINKFSIRFQDGRELVRIFYTNVLNILYTTENR